MKYPIVLSNKQINVLITLLDQLIQSSNDSEEELRAIRSSLTHQRNRLDEDLSKTYFRKRKQ